MKSSKKVLAFALAAAMVVTAVPATNAQAASTAKLSAKKATVYSAGYKTVTVTTPKSWKSVKVCCLRVTCRSDFAPNSVYKSGISNTSAENTMHISG